MLPSTRMLLMPWSQSTPTLSHALRYTRRPALPTRVLISESPDDPHQSQLLMQLSWCRSTPRRAAQPSTSPWGCLDSIGHQEQRGASHDHELQPDLSAASTQRPNSDLGASTPFILWGTPLQVQSAADAPQYYHIPRPPHLYSERAF
uniref:Uncharacterized protein n=1 Tax=Haptolina brevifila TaxID=156173 RepID=A0A7S2IRX8_9EUKA|mmetsp:Transcript_70559/g.139834  ORF Transcript_70559/g.139834 Transcript_70559/m.139834 type:complete len:147 (+) Transcript_70559:92-532(+)